MLVQPSQLLLAISPATTYPVQRALPRRPFIFLLCLSIFCLLTAAQQLAASQQALPGCGAGRFSRLDPRCSLWWSLLYSSNIVTASMAAPPIGTDPVFIRAWALYDAPLAAQPGEHECTVKCAHALSCVMSCELRCSCAAGKAPSISNGGSRSFSCKHKKTVIFYLQWLGESRLKCLTIAPAAKLARQRGAGAAGKGRGGTGNAPWRSQQQDETGEAYVPYEPTGKRNPRGGGRAGDGDGDEEEHGGASRGVGDHDHASDGVWIHASGSLRGPMRSASLRSAGSLSAGGAALSPGILPSSSLRTDRNNAQGGQVTVDMQG